MHAGREIGVVGIRAQVLEWQHGDGIGQNVIPIGRQRTGRADVSIYEPANGNDKEPDKNILRCATCRLHARTTVSDQTFRRQIEGPTDNQGNGKSNGQQHNDERIRPVGEPERCLDRRDDLYEQPRNDRIDCGYLKNLTSFDLPQERHGGSLTFFCWIVPT